MYDVNDVLDIINLQADSLLLGGDDVLPGGGLLLHCLLPLDLQKWGVIHNVIKTTYIPRPGQGRRQFRPA